jgi:phosphatidylinositol alpha-1,6-mannosyltransferase
MTQRLGGRRKVLVLAPSLKSIGGIQNYTHTLINGLQDVLGEDQVRVIAVRGEPEALQDGRVALRPSVKFRFLTSALTEVISWSPDLMICAHVGVAPVARFIQKLTGIPYWVVLYGIEVWGDLPAVKRDALRAAQRYVAITRFTLNATIARHSLNALSPLILPPTLPKGPPRSPETNYVTSDDSRRPMVLTVGRIAASEQYKGHDIMLEAWPFVLRRVPDAVYWIVGDGDDRQRLEQRARELGISGSLHFAGSVSHEELDVCYYRCCVFAMPTRTELDARVPRGEGFGIVFLEAMAHGRPVVGPCVGAPAEFIHSGEHGLLVNPKAPLEVAQALIELLEDPARARRMGHAAREWVAREFTFERFCERLRDAF